MKNKNIITSIFTLGCATSLFLIILLGTGCKKFLQIPLPLDKISGSSAYTNDNSGAAALNNILGDLAASNLFEGSTSIGTLSGLYTDETKLYSISNDLTVFYKDAIPINAANKPWVFCYNEIYNCSLTIEGIKNTTSLLPNKNQWIGEALFIRAFLYFNLVNLYGDVPLAITSDYRVNSTLSRSPKSEVYKQIVSDLEEAKLLLSDQYRNASSAVTTDRIRPNRAAVTALLARVYLFMQDWPKAEEQASILIDNKTDFLLPPLSQVFLSSSKETIWSLVLEPTSAEPYVDDITTYGHNVPAVMPLGKTLRDYAAAAMSNSLYNAFETGDQRLVNWGSTAVTTAVSPAQPEVYHLISKYKSAINRAEDIIVFRLAEQYLIRAEARAKQNKFTGTGSAKDDLDAVRTRAGLSGTTASSAADMFAAIAKERRSELFSEMGHRFFDLKRTGAIDGVMAIEAPLKAGTWSSQRQIWPIPTADIFANPNLTQAPGY